MKVEYFEEHLAQIHQSTLHNPSRKGWSGGAVQFFEFKFKLSSNLDVRLQLKHLPPCQTTVKNILIAEQKATFQRIEHGLAQQLDYETVVDIPVASSILTSSKCKYRLILFAMDHSGCLVEEHHWMTLPKPFTEFIKSVRKAELAAMKRNNVTPRRDQQRLPLHVSNPKIRDYFSDKWYFYSPRNNSTSNSSDWEYQLLTKLDNNRRISLENYVDELKLLNCVEDLYVLEKVVEAVFEYRQVDIEQSGVYWTRVNEFDLVKLSGVIGENDFIVLQKIGTSQELSGIIEGFENGKLFFTLQPGKTASTKNNYNIFFEKNRTSLRMEQEALTKLPKKLIKDYTFPTEYGNNGQSYKM